MNDWKKASDYIQCLDTDEIDDDTFMQSKIDAFNNEEEKAKYFQCDKCKNKGLIAVIQNREMKIKPCECQSRIHYYERAEKSGMGELLKLKLDNYIVKLDWQKNLKEKASEFIKSGMPTWFAMVGQVGSGKTTLCSIVANELLKTKRVLYITWSDYTSNARRKRGEELEDYLWEVKTVEVLFIDDILKGYNEYDLRLLFDLINYRYNGKKQTIMTSEKTRDELLEIDQATFSRVVERCDGYFISVKRDNRRNQRIKGIEI